VISDCGEFELSRTVEVVPATPEDTEPPPIPGQLSPQDDSAFDYYPRELTLRWFPVDDPSGVTYGVEVEVFYPASPGPGGEWGYRYGDTGLDSTSFSLNFVGAQPGRWRVWAIDGAGNPSAKTEWWYFEFMR
jgi:hypothetical protein